MKKKRLIVFFISILPVCASAQLDFSEVTADRELGKEFVMVTSGKDNVCMPIVKRNGKNVKWLSNRIIDISADGEQLAFLAVKNNTTNIFIKDLNKQGTSTQRTNRQAILDFSFSPDGKYICFSEKNGKLNQIYQTSAQTGYICRQITSDNQDYSPSYSYDMTKLFFARQDGNGISVCSYNLDDNYLESYSAGMNPCPLKNNQILCTRINADGRSEIWRIDIEKGIEECMVSDPNKSFTTPSLSPDGKWILMVGSSIVRNGSFLYGNTDIYVCNIETSTLLQLTSHPADDLSPVWGKDGRHIYFISQRGSSNETANVWRMTFNH